MSKSRINAKKSSPYDGNNSVKGKADYPLSREVKHNKQEPTKGVPRV